MTNFRPTTLSPEALKVWDEAEANIQASLQRIRELTDPVRKPTEPGLKEQALESLRFLGGNSRDVDTIRRALEQLDTPAARWGADQELENMADLEPALLEQCCFAPKEPITEDKKPLSLVYNCHFKGMPPNPHQSWQDYFTHCAATGIISNLRIEAIQPTPSVNDTLLDAADD